MNQCAHVWSYMDNGWSAADQVQLGRPKDAHLCLKHPSRAREWKPHLPSRERTVLTALDHERLSGRGGVWHDLALVHDDNDRDSLLTNAHAG
jgi:hypothetical protein